MQDDETIYRVDLSDRDEPSDEELQSASKRIKKKFFKSLDQITDQVLNLALNAEKEDVRLRASNRILDELSDRGRPSFQPPVSVQIVNNIPMDRTPVIEGKAGTSVEWEGAKIGVPKNLRRITGASEPPAPTRGAVYGGAQIKRDAERTVGFTNDPVAVQVPVLPKRDKG